MLSADWTSLSADALPDDALDKPDESGESDVEDEEDLSEEVEALLSDVLEEAEAATFDPDEVALEEPTTSLESVDAVSQAASNIVAAQIVSKRFIMEFPI